MSMPLGHGEIGGRRVAGYGTIPESGEVADAELRWFEYEEPFDALLLAASSPMPAVIIEEIGRAAEDPAAVEETRGGTYAVELDPRSLELFAAEPDDPSIGWLYDPERYAEFDEDPEGTRRRVRELEDRLISEGVDITAEVTIDDEGRLTRVVHTVQVRLPEEFEDCAVATEDFLAMTMTQAYDFEHTATRPAVLDVGEIGTAEDLDALREAQLAKAMEELQAQMPGDMQGLLPGAGDAAGIQGVELQTVAGPRYRNEVLRYLIDWATEAGIDWTKIPPLTDEQLLSTFDTWFEQHAGSEGGALDTADGRWLRSDVRQVLEEDGRSAEELDAMPNAEMVAAFDELNVRSGGRGSLGPGTGAVTDVYSIQQGGGTVEGDPLADSEVSFDEGGEEWEEFEEPDLTLEDCGV
jgi:hypothetical protein